MLRDRLGRTVIGVLVLAWTLVTPGCSLEDGAQEGIEAGTEAAIAALIQAPVNEFLDQTFGGD